MLIGGELAIASSIQTSGLISWIGENINIDEVPIFIIVVLVVFLMVFLKEINSNTSTTAASCAFMLPLGTGPNASVLAGGKLSTPQMAKVGFGLNILAVAFITVLFI